LAIRCTRPRSRPISIFIHWLVIIMRSMDINFVNQCIINRHRFEWIVHIRDLTMWVAIRGLTQCTIGIYTRLFWITESIVISFFGFIANFSLSLWILTILFWVWRIWWFLFGRNILFVNYWTTISTLILCRRIFKFYTLILINTLVTLGALIIEVIDII